MVRALSLEEQIGALDRGMGVLHPEGWTLIDVRGGDAETWLNDLVTADIASLPAGGSLRSLLLGPTGRIRADLLVHRAPGGFLLLQSPGQPRRIDELLQPYILSSDIVVDISASTPVVRPAATGPWVVSTEAADGEPVGPEAFESWRIRARLARFPIDLDEASLPAEAGLDQAPIVDGSKGCYLGQESVAKIHNLGHPTRLVVAVQASEPVRRGQEVIGDAEPVGLLTSVDEPGGGRAALARIRWEARDIALTTGAGISLAPR